MCVWFQTIRLRSNDLEQISSTIWNPVIVIHLVRDPRGIIASRLAYPYLWSNGNRYPMSTRGVRKAARELCSAYTADERYLRTKYMGKWHEWTTRSIICMMRNIQYFQGRLKLLSLRTWLIILKVLQQKCINFLEDLCQCRFSLKIVALISVLHGTHCTKPSLKFS